MFECNILWHSKGDKGDLPFCVTKEYASLTEKRTLISILIPLYNEEGLIGECLRRVLNASLPAETDLEIVIVDDGSTDDSLQAVVHVQSLYPRTIRLISHWRNKGKGAAIHTALQHASGDFCIIQDADLEYSPEEYLNLLEPLCSGIAGAVFGSRFVGARNT